MENLDLFDVQKLAPFNESVCDPTEDENKDPPVKPPPLSAFKKEKDPSEIIKIKKINICLIISILLNPLDLQ